MRQMQKQQEAYDQSQMYRQLISGEAQLYFFIGTLFVTVLMAATVLLGATWIFAPLYVGVAVAYITGALYLFKKLWTQ
jgi:hypothetical protein